MKMLSEDLPVLKPIWNTDTMKHVRHWWVRRFSPRDRYTLTRFYRSPSQYDVLCRDVVPYLRPDGSEPPLTVACLGCSNGAEAYSIASVLKSSSYRGQFSVAAFDIDKELVARAATGRYFSPEIFKNPFITETFLQSTFERVDDRYLVRPEVKQHVRFAVQDILSDDMQQLGRFDIVYAQNILVNMPPALARRAFLNICQLLDERAALFVDGVDLGLKVRWTRRCGLRPVTTNMEEIYREAKEFLGEWPYWYSGLEPLAATLRDAAWRYATIFLKG